MITYPAFRAAAKPSSTVTVTSFAGHPAEGAELRAGMATPGQVAEGDPLHHAQAGVLNAQRQMPTSQADRMQRDAGQPQWNDVHARACRQLQHSRLAADGTVQLNRPGESGEPALWPGWSGTSSAPPK